MRHCVSLATAAETHLPDWPERITPHVLRLLRLTAVSGRDGPDRDQEALGHAWVATTMNYIHVHASHVEDAWVTGQQRAADRLKGSMKWNLRLAAANRGIWKASELQRMLAGAGLTISAGKMSGLWSGSPASMSC